MAYYLNIVKYSSNAHQNRLDAFLTKDYYVIKFVGIPHIGSGPQIYVYAYFRLDYIK